MTKNKYIKTVQPSQIVNFIWFVLPVIFLFFPPLMMVFIIIAIYKFYDVDTWKYNFHEQTIEERRGVFDVVQSQVYYYRIKSIMVEQPFFMRIFGLSVIHIVTSEQFKPRLIIYGVYYGEDLKEFISDLSYDWRLKMNIRDHDIYNI
jgi:membrane protein YdbS with pleckstrin-like domain